MQPRTKLFGYTPFFRITLAFLLGILLSGLVHLPFPVCIVLNALLLLLLVSVYCRSKHKTGSGRIFSVLLLVQLTLLGFLYARVSRHNLFPESLPDVPSRYYASVLEKSAASGKRFQYILQLNALLEKDSIRSIREKIVAYATDTLIFDAVQPGSGLVFRARLREIGYNDNPGEFNYAQYMKRKGIRYQARVYDKMLIGDQTLCSFRIKATQIRDRLLAKYREHGIVGDEFAVLAALSLGEKNFLDPEQKQNYSAAGAMHVLAVSGLHVGVIYLVLIFLLRPLDRSKRLKTLKMLLVFIFLWFYAFITGLSPSVLRSCTLFSFLTLGENLNRKSNTYNTLAVSAFVLMLIQPDIIREVGFQLSYAAVFSIVYFQPRISKIWNPSHPVWHYLWGIFTVSLAAQLGTAPISLFYFHQFPTWFWLSNFIVIPAAAVVLYLSVAFFLVLPVQPIAEGIAWILRWLVRALNGSVAAIESLPGSVIPGVWLNGTELLFLYLILFTVSYALFTRKGKVALLSLSFITTLLFVGCIQQINTHKRTALLIYNDYNGACISIIKGKQHDVFTGNKELSPYTRRMLANGSGFLRLKAPKILKPGVDAAGCLASTPDRLIAGNLSVLLSEEKSLNLIPGKEKFGMILWTDSIYISHEIIKNEKWIVETPDTIRRRIREKKAKVIREKIKGVWMIKIR